MRTSNTFSKSYKDSTEENLYFDLASIKNFKETYVQNSLEKKILQYANMLLEGFFSVGYDSIPLISFDTAKIDLAFWRLQNQKLSNTYLLYAFGLRPIYILARAFEKTDGIQYFKLASSLVNSFHDYLFYDHEINPFVHNDHANVERVENLVFFGYVAQKKQLQLKNKQIINDLIIDCRNWLYDDAHYQHNHNHGIMADKGLIIAAYSANDQLSLMMINHAIERLKEQIAFSYGNDGVHLENSFDYHLTIADNIKSILSFLTYIGHPYKDELKLFLDKTYEFQVYAYKPNLQRPLFGDSKGTKSKFPGKIENTDKPNLMYIATKGKKGEKPQRLVSFFPNSGYVFLREHFEAEGFSDSTWISLKAGYKSRVHKHQDDLSIGLFSRGFDIFIDAGMYNFMYHDKLNRYMESVAAHTTVGIPDKSYSIARNNGEAFVIQQVTHNENYEYVLASSRVYPDCAIYRHLFYFRQKNIIVIYDEIHSAKSQDFVQYFHLSPELKTLSLRKDRSVFQIGNSGYSAVVKQLKPVKGINILSGTQTDPMSILSTGFSEYMETESLQYLNEGKTTHFLCAVEIKPNEFARSKEFDLTAFLNGKLLVGDFSLPLPQQFPVMYTKAGISSDEMTLRIQNCQSPNNDYEFALYVFDHKTKQIVEKLAYTSNEFLEYTFNKPGEYDLLYYISNKHREKIKGILASVLVDNKSILVNKEYSNLYRPIVDEIVSIQKSNNEYQFIIPIEYDFSYSCSWWVYREGINLHYKNNKNLNKFSYKFVDPGNYVIMCSVSDKYFGEFFFGQSKTIPIFPVIK